MISSSYWHFQSNFNTHHFSIIQDCHLTNVANPKLQSVAAPFSLPLAPRRASSMQLPVQWHLNRSHPTCLSRPPFRCFGLISFSCSRRQQLWAPRRHQTAWWIHLHCYLLPISFHFASSWYPNHRLSPPPQYLQQPVSVPLPTILGLSCPLWPPPLWSSSAKKFGQHLWRLLGCSTLAASPDCTFSLLHPLAKG